MTNSIHTETTTEVLLETAVVREPPAPAPFQQPLKPHKSGAIFTIVLGVIAIFVLLLVLRRGKTNTISTSRTETVSAATKDFVKVVRLVGTTEAVRSRPLLAPKLEGAQLGAMVVTKLAPAGKYVHQGDTLVEFDRQAQLKDALDKRGAYQDLADQVAEKRAAADAARANDETELKQAEDGFKKAQLEITKADIVSRIDAEKNQETLQEAESTLKQLQQTFKLKREAAAADIRTLEIQAQRAQATMLYAEANAKKMTLVSPMDGVVVLNTIWTGGRMGEIQEGDEVRPGVPFMRVVDPSQMEVAVEANQADFLSLQVGQRVRVYLDAYPGLTLTGELEQLTPLAHAGRFSAKVRSFPVLFSIDGSNPNLMPDLSAAVDVELGSQAKAVVLPVQSVERENGNDYVWLSTTSGFEKRSVKTGPRNDLEIVIESGLKSGDIVRRDATLARGAS